MRKSQVQNSGKLKVLLRGNFLCTSRNWGLKEIQEWLTWSFNFTGNTRRHHPFISLGKDRRWKRLLVGQWYSTSRIISPAQVSLAFLSSGRMRKAVPSPQKLTLRSLRNAPGSIPITTEAPFVRCCGWDCVKWGAERNFPPWARSH